MNDCQICTARTICQRSLKPHSCHFHLDAAEAARRAEQANDGEKDSKIAADEQEAQEK